MSYFRLEHYVPARVMEKLDTSYIKEELPKLHSTYVGASEKEIELEFLKVSDSALFPSSDFKIPFEKMSAWTSSEIEENSWKGRKLKTSSQEIVTSEKKS